MPIPHRARHVVVGGVLLSLLLVATPARATVRAGSLDHSARFLLDDAPSWLFPGAGRGEPIAVSQLTAGRSGNGFKLSVRPLTPPDPSADITTRIAFFPAGGRPWALEWQTGDTKAAVVTRKRAGTLGTDVDALPSWTATGSKRPLLTEGDVVDLTLPRSFLEKAGVKLPDLSGVQVEHEETRPDGSVIFQGSPIVDWGAVIGKDPELVLPPVGITYDADHHSQPWNVVDVCPRCTRPPLVTIEAAATLEERVTELENTTSRVRKRVSVTVSGWVVKTGDWWPDEVRAYGAKPDESDGSSTEFEDFDGAICDSDALACQLFLGNDHDATITGDATLEKKGTGRHIEFTIIGADFLAPPGFVQYDLLVKSTPDATTSVAMRTPWVYESLPPPPPGTVTPTSAQGFYLDAATVQPFGLSVDSSQLSTTTDANQLPVGETTRSTYATNGFLAELLNFYPKPGSTDFFSQSVDVFGDSAGRDNIHEYLDGQVASATGVTVVQQGRGTRPTILQTTSGGVTTTTAYFDAGDNAIVVLRSACNQCTPEQALEDFRPMLRAVEKQVRTALSK